MLFIKYVCRIPLRMSEEDMLIGDDAVHGECGYCLFDDVEGLAATGHVLEGQRPSNPSIEATNGVKKEESEGFDIGGRA